MNKKKRLNDNGRESSSLQSSKNIMVVNGGYKL